MKLLAGLIILLGCLLVGALIAIACDKIAKWYVDHWG